MGTRGLILVARRLAALSAAGEEYFHVLDLGLLGGGNGAGQGGYGLIIGACQDCLSMAV